MLYLDLDGVVADFDRMLIHEGEIVKNDNSFIHKSESEWTPENRWLDRFVTGKMATPGFWSSFPVTEGGKELVDYCRPFRPTFLTAVPSNLLEHRDWIEYEKRCWVEENFPGIPVIVCLRKEKILHPDWNRPLNILIDDMAQNIKEWNNVGGLGILHTSAEDSIRRLDHIIREMF